MRLAMEETTHVKVMLLKTFVAQTIEGRPHPQEQVGRAFRRFRGNEVDLIVASEREV